MNSVAKLTNNNTKEINNFKCSRNSCNAKFYIAPKDNTIRCPICGYRIVDKLRTQNYITYKTE